MQSVALLILMASLSALGNIWNILIILINFYYNFLPIEASSDVPCCPLIKHDDINYKLLNGLRKIRVECDGGCLYRAPRKRPLCFDPEEAHAKCDVMPQVPKSFEIPRDLSSSALG